MLLSKSMIWLLKKGPFRGGNAISTFHDGYSLFSLLSQSSSSLPLLSLLPSSHSRKSSTVEHAKPTRTVDKISVSCATTIDVAVPTHTSGVTAIRSVNGNE